MHNTKSIYIYIYILFMLINKFQTKKRYSVDVKLVENNNDYHTCFVMHKTAYMSVCQGRLCGL